MKILGQSVLHEHFEALGVRRERNVLIHSNMAACGVIEGGVTAAYAVLRKLLGDAATVIVPTYRIAAPANEVFDPLRSPSLQVGSFSEYVRQRAGAYRSICPIHSHSFDGPLASVAKKRGLSASFGPGSDFEFLIENDVYCIFLGCDFEKAGTFVFHSQATVGTVPYRSWQKSVRWVKMPGDEGCTIETQLPYYARHSDAPRETRLPMQDRLRNEGFLRDAPLPYGTSMGFQLQSVHERVVEMLEDDPLLCVARERVPS